MVVRTALQSSVCAPEIVSEEIARASRADRQRARVGDETGANDREWMVTSTQRGIAFQ